MNDDAKSVASGIASATANAIAPRTVALTHSVSGLKKQIMDYFDDPNRAERKKAGELFGRKL